MLGCPVGLIQPAWAPKAEPEHEFVVRMVKSSQVASSGGHRLAMGAVTKAAPLLQAAPEHVDDGSASLLQ